MKSNEMNQSKIIVAGIGPGSRQDITPAVKAALQEADAVIGYKCLSPLTCAPKQAASTRV